MISPLAYIHPEAKIGENVEIAPFVFIDKNVVIGDNNKIMANANILYGSRIGNGNTIFPGAVIGAIPQDLKFRGEESTAEIGDNNLIRENVTINRGTAAKGRTIVGNNNLLMEGVHVAHDALVGNGCIIGNSTKMAGEIVIDDNAIVSANVLMHQFCHVGSHVMIQGGCRFSKDIPPYIIAGREPIAFSGINIIGLRRRGFANEVIENIHNAYRIIYQSGLNTTEALKKIEDEMDADDAVDLLEKLGESVKQKLRPLIGDETKTDIRLINHYDEDEIGSLITTNYICITGDLTIRKAMHELIRQAGENDNISTIYAVDGENKFCGAIDLKDLIIARENDDLKSIISYAYPYLFDHFNNILRRYYAYDFFLFIQNGQ